MTSGRFHCAQLAAVNPLLDGGVANLKRNGCVAPDFVFDYSDTTTKQGNAPHTSWDPMYPMCVKYTGCPAAYPVVWCALQGGHQVDNSGGVSYKAGIWKFWSSLPAR